MTGIPETERPRHLLFSAGNEGGIIELYTHDLEQLAPVWCESNEMDFDEHDDDMGISRASTMPILLFTGGYSDRSRLVAVSADWPSQRQTTSLTSRIISAAGSKPLPVFGRTTYLIRQP